MAQINASEVDVKTAFQIGNNGAMLMRGFANPYATGSGLDDDEFSLAPLTSLYFDVVNANLWIKKTNTNLDINDWSNMSAGTLLNSFETDWIYRTDWTNVHLGSNMSQDVDSDVTHNLNTSISNLLVKVLFSPTGNDSDSIELIDYEAANSNPNGITIINVDNNKLIVQTGSGGIRYVDSDGNVIHLGSSATSYYKIVVYKLR